MTSFDDGKDGKCLGCLTRCGCQRPWDSNGGRATSLEIVQSCLKRCLSRVHYAGVDVSHLCESEQVCSMFGVAELI